VNGKLVIPTHYQITAGGFGIFRKEEKGFVGGLARVKKDKKWGFLKPDGAVLGGQWFENAELFQK
ncbi:MAG: WG repeat-containing protein, partial [Flavobacterium sp.]